ncbi:hypothetical protein BU26DRAFT_584265 [Trematosphaeria pertusa]|uniref:DUF7703 domain-containing protein n=1 Tax=Trematosphaeria pertusa TaxID=390896 RepID=A0A6A6IYS8_9PLEO|nr:uncharacterized protein BU26DRAFT_584265 [Trematosphaeria pertusa]KAF2255458.1 hypothetical protein BU26DRAFT_584265 [Trematosphaeria pertusa]
MARDNGIGADYEVSYPIALTLIVFLGISVYNVIELMLVIFTTFKRRHGLYFYSLLVATLGIIPYALGFFFKFYNITSSRILYLTLIAVGWPCMITGQSVVLYSRLHLIYRSSADTGRWVLVMIVVDAIVCHVPVIVLLYGANSSNPEPFLTPYSIYEKVQITIFFLQEVIISGLYLYKTSKLLRAECGIRGRNSRLVMTHLIWVNVMIIILDITLLAIEYAGYYDVQVVYKAAVYSIKLKMEFSILNRLLDLFQGRIHDSSDDPRSHPTVHGHTTFKRSAGKSNTANGTVLAGTTTVGNSMGNSAYARMDDNISPISGISAKDMEVVKTTEIRIESADRFPSRDVGDIELESVAGKSSNAEGVQRSASTSSSELRIVPHGY